MSSILNLPEEIQVEVFLKFPLKSILSCKCVCKRWYNLISKPDFTKRHLKLITSLNMNSFISMNNSSLCYVEYDFDDEQQCYPEPKKELLNLSSLSCLEMTDTDGDEIHIIGSCNGLVCFRAKNWLHVYICNPVTRECVQLPSLIPVKTDDYSVAVLKFGYVCSTDEYKVVRLSTKFDFDGKRFTRVEAYTLGDGRGWRSREIAINSIPFLGYQCVYVDGALYCIGNTVVFDFMDEQFHSFAKPPCSSSSPGWAISEVGVLGGQACLYCLTTTRESAEIWFLTKRMNEEIGNTSDVTEQQDGDCCKYFTWIWSKGPTVTMNEGMFSRTGFVRPLTRTNNGDILLLYKEKRSHEPDDVIIRYDPKTSISKNLGDFGLPSLGCGKAAVHVNSLISLKSLGERTVT